MQDADSCVAESGWWGPVCRCMLEAGGLLVRSIPFYEWNSLQGLDQQKAYLSRLLSSVTSELPTEAQQVQPVPAATMA